MTSTSPRGLGLRRPRMKSKTQPTQAARMLFRGLSLVALWLTTIGVGGVVAQSHASLPSGSNGGPSHGHKFAPELDGFVQHGGGANQRVEVIVSSVRNRPPSTTSGWRTLVVCT